MKEEYRRNSTRVVLQELNRDERGEFIGYCNFYKHRGVIGRGRMKKCLERNCEHYRIFREQDK